jgi:ABC-type dipeptide/oligopeptide/nickel transport system ATPase component
MNMIAIVGTSGSGKSTALGNIPELGIEGLSPQSTAIVNVNGKPLPFKGWRNQYKELILDKGPAGIVVKQDGNYLASDNAGKIVAAIQHWDSKPDIQTIVIDDWQYIMANIFMAKALQTGLTC